MEKILITGIDGFAATHLAEYILHSTGCEVFGTTRRQGTQKKGRLSTLQCDLLEPESLDAALRKASPDRIFHLAGQPSVSDSWNDIKGTFDANAIGTANLFESASKHCPRARIVLASSSEVYGEGDAGSAAVPEGHALSPLNPYGVSKASAEMLARIFINARGLDIVIARAFPHTGPGSRRKFAFPSWAAQLAEIRAGKNQQAKITGGALENVRELLDVRDVVRAYWALSERGKCGEAYNICSGRAVPIGEALGMLVALSGTGTEIARDDSVIRPADVKSLRGDCSKIFSHTGWKAQIGLKQTLTDLLEYWNERVLEESAGK